MSWFNDTFGDSINSLKGQITKITKEVLADDEAANSQKESEVQLVKELEALCESKDLEIASARDELDKLHKEIVFLRSVNESQNGGEDLVVQTLKNELEQVKQERDHLNSCLDELQSEHQTNISQVLVLKDKYKSELDALKKDYDGLKAQLEDSTNGSASEVNLLTSKIQELNLELENERKKSTALNEEVRNQNNLTEQVKKLSDEIQVLHKDKEKTEDEKKNLKTENEDLKNKLILSEKNEKESEIKYKILLNEKEELLKKCQDLENIEASLSNLTRDRVEIQGKLTKLLKSINTNAAEGNISELFASLENELQEKNNWGKSNLELELQKLQEENSNYENKLKIFMEKESETERKYEEEILLLKNSLSQLKEHECLNQSQTDDVKRLEQEVSQCMNLLLVKDREISDYSRSLKNLEQELKNLKESSSSSERELITFKNDKEKLEREIESLKNLNNAITQQKVEIENNQRVLESEKVNLTQSNLELKKRIDELEKQISDLTNSNEKIQLHDELNKIMSLKTELEKKNEELQKENLNLKNNCEQLKAQVIVKESNLTELMKSNMYFQEEMNKLQAENHEMINSVKEMQKWRDASIDLQIQVEDLTAKRDEVMNECQKLRAELETMQAGIAERGNEVQSEQSSSIELEEKCKNQSEMILQLQEEKNELQCRVKNFQEQMKTQMLQAVVSKDDAQQHRRSKSDVNTPESLNNEEVLLLKQSLQQEQARNQMLQHQFMEISNKEASARKEFERLRQHLIEVEDHYTEETVENEKVINDLKAKLIAAEEQLQNSSTLYTSLKVRDNQHLESLQSQIRMITAQRDDFQEKLSSVEDEVQKHKASLMSLQIVLEQFQQDKERELEQVAMKYEKQLQMADARYRDLESDIEGLKKQLEEAKNGLKAASRLGELLEKKTQHAAELEESQKHFNSRIAELESSLSAANQANNGKIDKSLIKNLVLGYVLSPNADRKSQVLRIMSSVLDFDEVERNKIGVDANKSGWLSNILHPKGEDSPGNQSLSEAFIKFLESESRPQPQLKLLPEQHQPSVSKPSRTSPSPSGRLSELTLPTFNSSQDSDSSIILKNLLKDS